VAAKEDHSARPSAEAGSRRIPIAYLAFAHVALGTACALLVVRPEPFTTFFLDPFVAGTVHLVTLGWILCSVLGATSVVLPLALRTPLRANTLDAVACALVLVGASGIASHFWFGHRTGMAWSAAALVPGVLLAAARVLPPLWRSPTPRLLVVPITLAWLDLVLAAALGIGLALDPGWRVFPDHLGAVFAHAHLA
jgi:hypothetical protein